VKVSVLIVTWNGKYLLEECFQALKKQTYTDFEVIVVDNGSQDGTRDYLDSLSWPILKTKYLPSNHGFSGGNNAALEVASGEVIALLNNDARPDELWLEKGVAALKEGADMVSCRILKADGSTIDKTGHLIYRDGLNRGKGTGESDGPAFSTSGPSLWPDGCAAFYRTSMIDQIGFFDDDFYLYGEDADLGFRARRAGYSCVYEPESCVLHLQSASLGKFNPNKIFYVERNRIYLLIKNFPVSWILLSPWFTLKRYAMNVLSLFSGKGAAAGFRKEQSSLVLARVLIKATFAGMRGIPKMWKKRKKVSNTMSNREIKALLKKYSISARELTLSD